MVTAGPRCDGVRMSQEQAFSNWAIVDVRGGARLGGWVTGQEIAGASFVRVEVPGAGDASLYPAGDVCRITVTTQARALALAASRPPVSIDLVRRTAARFYRLSEGDLSGARRERGVARARQVAMYLSQELTGESLPAIGRAFGARHHTTTLRAIAGVRRDLAADSRLRGEVESIRAWVEQEAEAAP
jgi:hypothetical protein